MQAMTYALETTHSIDDGGWYTVVLAGPKRGKWREWHTTEIHETRKESIEAAKQYAHENTGAINMATMKMQDMPLKFVDISV